MGRVELPFVSIEIAFYSSRAILAFDIAGARAQIALRYPWEAQDA